MFCHLWRLYTGGEILEVLDNKCVIEKLFHIVCPIINSVVLKMKTTLLLIYELTQMLCLHFVDVLIHGWICWSSIKPTCPMIMTIIQQ